MIVARRPSTRPSASISVQFLVTSAGFNERVVFIGQIPSASGCGVSGFGPAKSRLCLCGMMLPQGFRPGGRPYDGCHDGPHHRRVRPVRHRTLPFAGGGRHRATCRSCGMRRSGAGPGCRASRPSRICGIAERCGARCRRRTWSCPAPMPGTPPPSWRQRRAACATSSCWAAPESSPAGPTPMARACWGGGGGVPRILPLRRHAAPDHDLRRGGGG